MIKRFDVFDLAFVVLFAAGITAMISVVAFGQDDKPQFHPDCQRVAEMAMAFRAAQQERTPFGHFVAPSGLGNFGQGIYEACLSDR